MVTAPPRSAKSWRPRSSHITRTVPGISEGQARTFAGEITMGLQIIYGLGALILLTALIYGTLHYASRTATRAGEETVRDRHKNDPH